MSYSNYPPGVTGMEYEIAGPDVEYDTTIINWCPNEDCSLYNQDQDIEIEMSRYHQREWGTAKCSECGHTWDIEREID